MITQNKTPDAGSSFDGAQPLTPADKLLAWLDEQKRIDEPRLLKLPVVLAKGAMGYGTANAKIGDAPDAITVFLDDSALGMGIADRARSCNGKPRCAMLVEAYWAGKGAAGDLELRVMRVIEIIEGDVPKIAQVEAPGPNSN